MPGQVQERFPVLRQKPTHGELLAGAKMCGCDAVLTTAARNWEVCDECLVSGLPEFPTCAGNQQEPGMHMHCESIGVLMVISFCSSALVLGGSWSLTMVIHHEHLSAIWSM